MLYSSKIRNVVVSVVKKLNLKTNNVQITGILRANGGKTTNIFAVLVVEKGGKVLGIVTSDSISRPMRGERLSNPNDQET